MSALSVMIVAGGCARSVDTDGTVQPSGSPKFTVSPTVAASTSPPRTITLVLPSKLNGRSMLKDSSHQKFNQNWIDYIENFGTGRVRFFDAVAAFYKTPGRLDRVWVAAAKGNQAYTAEDLKGTLTSFAGVDNTSKVETPFPIDAGPLGGVAVCAKLTDKDKSFYTKCFWSASDSYGMITWSDKSPSQVVNEFVSIRGQVEHVTRS